MPYVPSEKTNPPANDRKIIDAALEPLANNIADAVVNNRALLFCYKDAFMDIALCLANPKRNNVFKDTKLLADAILSTGKRHGYEGAFLGELNYAITRLIQRVPRLMVTKGMWKEKDELRYWVYARTVAALIYTSRHTEELELGIDGVFEDIKDEYKRRVNTAYEAEQILKSGDCYYTPYYTRLVEVVDEKGNVIGHQEIMLRRSSDTLRPDILGYQLVAKKRRKA